MAEQHEQAPGVVPFQPTPLERRLETLLSASRWLLAPFYLMLVIALGGLLLKALQEAWHFTSHVLSATESEVILGVLALIDLTFTGSLIVIVIFSGYENFVSKIDADAHRNWPEWMSQIDFSGLKCQTARNIAPRSASNLDPLTS